MDASVHASFPEGALTASFLVSAAAAGTVATAVGGGGRAAAAAAAEGTAGTDGAAGAWAALSAGGGCTPCPWGMYIGTAMKNGCP